MNLLELFVKIDADDSGFNKKTSQTESRAAAFGSKLANGMAVATKAIVAGTTLAAGAVGALVKSSVSQFAEYEQLVGGAELMFGEAFDDVMEKAKNAYATVQMSQNEYLTQVNGFAVGLKTSLGGNEKAAAELADKIVTAEADIVAATGNTQEAVQNAFNGIMKSNYTMLDNLGLGITPTKEGMQEVIDKVNEWNKANGEATSYQMGNLADMQAALVDYVEMQGMAGYAANEAADTISGSLAMTKAAWSNLILGLTDDSQDFDALVNGFVDSVGNLGTLIVPRVQTALKGVVKLIQELVPIIADALPPMINDIIPSLLEAATAIMIALVDAIPTLMEALIPPLIEGVISIVMAIVDALPTIIQTLSASLPTIIEQLVQALITLLPMLVDAGFLLLEGLFTGLIDALPTLIPQIVDIILAITEKLTEPNSIVMLVMAAIQLMLALSEGLINAIPQIVEALPIIVTNIVQALIILAPMLLEAGIELIKNLIVGISMMVDGLCEAGNTLMNQLIAKIVEEAKKLIEKGKELVENIIKGVVAKFEAIKVKGKELVEKVKAGFKEKVDDAKQWGKDLIQNFIDGLLAKWEALKSTVKDIAGSIKDFLGFSEPEKGPLSNFHTYAPDMMNLFMQGIKDNENALIDTVQKAFDFQDYISVPEMSTVSSNSSIEAMIGQLVATLPSIANQQIVLDTGALVGQTVSQYDLALGKLMANRARMV